MIRFRTIISRIISLHVIAITVTAIGMPLALYWLLSSAATELQHRALRENADTIAQYLTAENGSLRLDLPPGLRELYSESYGRYGFTVLDRTGRVLFSSLATGTAIFPGDRPSAPERFLESRRGDAVIYGASIEKSIGGAEVWIQVAQDLAHRDVLIDDIVADFFPRVGWITVPILLLLLAIDILIFRRALRPVRQASDIAETIGPARTNVRLPTDGMPREILPLVNAVNQALARLERGFRTQREFTADAAHELRTPLAILSARIDTLPDAAVREALRRDVAGMSRMVSQLLEIAELEDFVVDPGETTDLQNVAADVAAFIAPLAVAQGKAIALAGAEGPVWIAGNPETVFRAIRNLAENALNHTPAGTAVEIEVSADGIVRVLDAGPGVPVDERERIFRRFWRRDRRRPGSAGLGLSIVQRILEAHAGTIAVESRVSGGAVFSLSFRRAA
ncbi:MAG TPA: sensor histidine kinase [Stellaceae bacterium]|nr:sensor histidine kinase [Stellaceae bacterium]